ncbi:MAG: CRISPR system precrRNA processing endoribonuclease RAMP protein Cas6 [Desulfobacteraceae bacterium]|nr:CRISPR system precrRNA processing endoribonuclease RAMP protein Cas6 [Desulfobacteraceae bacterium]
MDYGKYTFSCRFINNAELPCYKGSTFRGVFGIALKRIACTFKNNECGSCLLNTHCMYALVFETDKAVAITSGSKFASVPHPFVIEPPLTEKTIFQPGDFFSFNILLFGNINKNIPYLIYALNEMGKIGLGKKLNAQRGRFKLATVSTGEKIIYKASEQKIFPQNSEMLNFLNRIKSDKDITLKLILETPLRLKFKNKFNADLPFHVLVRTLLRRLSSLLECYGAGEPDIDYSGLVKEAENIKTTQNNLKWFDWKRYSSRQNKKMLMGGITGTITYKGKLEKYLALLEFCSKTHIGKQTAFGLGKFYFEVIE